MDAAHKRLLTTLAQAHARHVQASLRLALAHFSEDHPTVKELKAANQLARETVEVIQMEPTRQAA